LAQSGCSAGQMCIAVDPGANQCVATGSGAQGSACTSDDACAPTLACAAVAGSDPMVTFYTVNATFLTRGGGTCLALCNPSQGSAACPAGSRCDQLIGERTMPRTDVGVCGSP
jgi:hypothetical protein